MERVQWGTKVSPIEPCVIGDAQSELIYLMILMIANNINSIYPRFYNRFCEGKKKLIDSFNKNDGNWRLDLDPRIPYLGEDQHGNLIEPTEEQLETCYEQHIKGTESDIGLDGYILSYYGSSHMKRFVGYIMECGYTPGDLKKHFGKEGSGAIHRKAATETEQEEDMAYKRAVGDMHEQSRMMLRFSAGAFGANAIYFFRNQQYINTIYLNPLEILCVFRSKFRRIAVINMCLQHNPVMPRALQQKLYDAIKLWNERKQRDQQRPRWGTHLAIPHILALSDIDIPAEFTATQAAAKAKPAAKARPSGEPATSSAPPAPASSVRPPTPTAPKAARLMQATAKAHADKGDEKGQQKERINRKEKTKAKTKGKEKVDGKRCRTLHHCGDPLGILDSGSQNPDTEEDTLTGEVVRRVTMQNVSSIDLCIGPLWHSANPAQPCPAPKMARFELHRRDIETRRSKFAASTFSSLTFSQLDQRQGAGGDIQCTGPAGPAGDQPQKPVSRFGYNGPGRFGVDLKSSVTWNAVGVPSVCPFSSRSSYGAYAESFARPNLAGRCLCEKLRGLGLQCIVLVFNHSFRKMVLPMQYLCCRKVTRLSFVGMAESHSLTLGLLFWMA
eukprot:s733_g2.t1